MEKQKLEQMLREPEKHIPNGYYCYVRINGGKRGCYFWEIIPDKPDYENGYCHYLKRGDWEAPSDDGTESPGLLFDQVKECGINSN